MPWKHICTYRIDVEDHQPQNAKMKLDIHDHCMSLYVKRITMPDQIQLQKREKQKYYNDPVDSFFCAQVGYEYKPGSKKRYPQI